MKHVFYEMSNGKILYPSDMKEKYRIMVAGRLLNGEDYFGSYGDYVKFLDNFFSSGLIVGYHTIEDLAEDEIRSICKDLVERGHRVYAVILWKKWANCDLKYAKYEIDKMTNNEEEQE
jgi:hypothetical protein